MLPCLICVYVCVWQWLSLYVFKFVSFFCCSCFCITECTSTTWYNLFICFWWHKSGTVLCQNSSRLASSIARHDFQVHMTRMLLLMLYAYNIYSTSIIRHEHVFVCDTVAPPAPLHAPCDLFLFPFARIYMTRNYTDGVSVHTTKINIKLRYALAFISCILNIL